MAAMMTVPTEISKSFSKQAHEYEQAATVQREIGSRLLERLQYVKLSPKYILDIGCGTGFFTKALTALFPKALVVGLDLSHGMLLQSRGKQGFWRKWALINANMQQLPFANGVFDLVFSNQALHWAYPLAQVFAEINRVMHQDACLMFSTLGPDTFKEIRTAWQAQSQFSHTNDFADMHEVGDALMTAHFLEPVMDMEMLSLQYNALPQLLDSLKKQGVKNINAKRNKGLTGKNVWKQFRENYESLRSENGKYPLSYEVVYGHAWKGMQTQTTQGLETFIPLSSIGRTRR